MSKPDAMWLATYRRVELRMKREYGAATTEELVYALSAEVDRLRGKAAEQDRVVTAINVRMLEGEERLARTLTARNYLTGT